MGSGQDALGALGEVALARVLIRQRRYAEADSLYRHALDVLRRLTTDDHPEVRRIAGLMADLYVEWEKPAEAERYRRLARGP